MEEIMPVYYKPVQKAEPGVAGGGSKKWYASAISNGETDINGLIRKVEKISTMSGGDIKGVTYSLVDAIIEELSAGRIVRIGELGDLQISISSEGHDEEEDVRSSSIRKSRINFRPGTRLKQMLNNLTFTKKS